MIGLNGRMISLKRRQRMLGILSAGIAPGLAILSYFYLKDQYRCRADFDGNQNLSIWSFACFSNHVYPICS